MSVVFNFHKPDRVVMLESNNTFGKFEFKPLEPGYGLTIGNALRRVLLSSLEGYAISSIKIEGVSHEFSTIEGVLEDVTEIILNLKQVRFKSKMETKKGSYEEYVNISLSGKKQFKAGDIEAFTPNFEVMNKDLVLCNMEDSVKLNIKMKIKNGRGFVLSDENEEENEEIGIIPIDSIYTPIKNVNYNIDNYRIDQKTDYEKLVFEITTDGSIHPKEALTQVSKLIIEHFMLCSKDEITIEEEEEQVNEIYDQVDMRMSHILGSKLEDLEISVRALNCLRSADINTLGELVKYRKEDLIKFRNFGKKSLVELEALLESKDLHFGMNVPSWKKK